jgi:uncharacterized membrane protein
MFEGTSGSPRKSRIESLSDLIFGLALSIGALTLIGAPPSNLGQLLQSILFYAFSFLILISVWYSYTRTMSQLHVETTIMVDLNILLLFLVSIEPFLFNQLISSQLGEPVSILYAFDLGGLFVIQTFLANTVLADKNRSEAILQSFRLQRITLLLCASLFFVSALPFFWSWRIEVSGAVIPLRIVLWLITLFMPSVRRLLERIPKK